jgi:hypothetical protein
MIYPLSEEIHFLVHTKRKPLLKVQEEVYVYTILSSSRYEWHRHSYLPNLAPFSVFSYQLQYSVTACTLPQAHVITVYFSPIPERAVAEASQGRSLSLSG